MNYNSKTLRLMGINYLKSLFNDSKASNLIEEKFKNISGKTGKYYVPYILYQKRTSRKNRVLIPYEHVIKNSLTMEMLNTFEGGVVVEFVNNDYFSEIESSKSSRNPIFSELESRLGSDDNVSAMISIRSTGESSSIEQRKALEKLRNFCKKNNINIEKNLIQRKPGISSNNISQGNDKWEGFIYYSVKGGEQDIEDSHNNIKSNNVQLFNPSVEYAGEEVSNDITIVLVYFALFSIRIKDRDDNWNNIVSRYQDYLKKQYYFNKDLLSYVHNHKSLIIVPNELIDPISCENIYIEDFLISHRNDNALDITHDSSVNKAIYKWEESRKVVMTPASPYNLFWSKHLSNMMQQDFSLEEYYEKLTKNVKRLLEKGIIKL